MWSKLFGSCMMISLFRLSCAQTPLGSIRNAAQLQCWPGAMSCVLICSKLSMEFGFTNWGAHSGGRWRSGFACANLQHAPGAR